VAELPDGIHANQHFDFVRQGGFFDELEANPVCSTGEGASGSGIGALSPTEHHAGSSGLVAEFGGDHSSAAGASLSRSNSLMTARRRATKNRMYHLSETEKKARHNAHTRSSRLRIDNGLDRLKHTLKKVRPSLKLTKKADIVDEAVRIIRETHDLPVTEEEDAGTPPSQDHVETGGASSMSV
jgi:hypothetical protein